MKNKKIYMRWILLLGYLFIFPIGLQISFVIKKYVGIPLYDYVHKVLRGYQLFPVYTIVICAIAAVFIAFMIMYSRKIADMYSLGMILPIGIVGINVITGIPMSSMVFAKFSYYFNSYNSHDFYMVLCILLTLLIIDGKVYGKH